MVLWSKTKDQRTKDLIKIYDSMVQKSGQICYVVLGDGGIGFEELLLKAEFARIDGVGVDTKIKGDCGSLESGYNQCEQMHVGLLERREIGT